MKRQIDVASADNNEQLKSDANPWMKKKSNMGVPITSKSFMNFKTLRATDRYALENGWKPFNLL